MRAVLIAGPTASGKSDLAVRIARAIGGAVVNADSQQIYRHWRILTARPSPSELAMAEHRLYGHVAIDQDYSVGHWISEVQPLLHGPCPVIVGGTGLYFKALTEGLAPIPQIPTSIRAEGEAMQNQMGPDGFAAELARRDPETAAELDLVNPRRVLRAWEVLAATGLGLAEWKAQTPKPLLQLDQCLALVLHPPREWLYARCDLRFDQMLAEGALDEVRAVMDLNLAPELPGTRAVGAAELAAFIAGDISVDQAADRAKMQTRRYAKRQLTWGRNQMRAWRPVDPSDPDALLDAVSSARSRLGNG